jgi:hypothetical protein
MTSSQLIVDGEALVVRSGHTIATSLARIESAEARIEKSARRSRYLLRGGAGDASDASMGERERVIHFIAHLPPNEVPGVYAGPSMGGKKCDLCGRDIMLGASEYELEFPSAMFRLDRRCLALWQSEMARN